jgi:hypothetical protein
MTRRHTGFARVAIGGEGTTAPSAGRTTSESPPPAPGAEVALSTRLSPTTA